MNSVWTETAKRAQFPSLHESKRTDVLIVGGGLAGMLCAFMLKNAGVDCMLVEADRIGNGITKNTTAKITVGHGLIYEKMIRQLGQEKARLYLDANVRAVKQYQSLCQTFPCDYQTKDSYVYSTKDRAKIEKEVAALNRLGCRAEFSDARELPFRVAGAVRVKGQAQFHPLKFLFGIAKQLPVWENTKILELAPHKAVTAQGEIRFGKAIIATHFPVLNKHGGYFLKLYQHRSYVIALDGAPCVNGMYVDDDPTGLSLRNYGNLLLLGGGAHRTGKKGGNYRELESVARIYYSGATVANRWATQDCMTLDGIPYIGQYAQSTPDLYVTTGFNKWGMTSAMVSAMLLTDLVRGKTTPYEPLFSPSRSIWHPQLAINALSSLAGLLTPTVPRCPHLGCALKYNPDEHSWDCPCHGSRFAENGQLIDNPATDDKKNLQK